MRGEETKELWESLFSYGLGGIAGFGLIVMFWLIFYIFRQITLDEFLSIIILYLGFISGIIFTLSGLRKYLEEKYGKVE